MKSSGSELFSIGRFLIQSVLFFLIILSTLKKLRKVDLEDILMCISMKSL